jgi:lipopolysaccharide export system permease protein
LYFDEYTLNINNNIDGSPRFKEASERNFHELFNPDKNINNLYKKEFVAEAHKRIMSPLIILIMVLIGAMTSIMGTFSKKTSIKKLFYSISAALIIQIYIIATPQLILQSSNIIVFLYIFIFIIFLLIIFLISEKAYTIKEKILYKLRLL